MIVQIHYVLYMLKFVRKRSVEQITSDAWGYLNTKACKCYKKVIFKATPNLRRATFAKFSGFFFHPN